MKAIATAVMLASLGLGLGMSAEAQQQQQRDPQIRDMPRDTQRDPATRPGMDRQSEQRQTFTRPEGVFDSRQIIGSKIRGSDGKDLGEIDRLLVDRDGKISHVVVGVGGVLGVGESRVVIPWSDVRLTTDPNNRDRLVAQVDRTALENAPRFERRAGSDRDRGPATSPRTEPAREPATRSNSTDRK